MKFSKWMTHRREQGPTKALVSTMRVEFDLTPEDVATLYAYTFMWKEDGEGDDEGLLDSFRAANTDQIKRYVKAALVDMGGSDYLFMYVGERMPSEALRTLAAMVVDRFVKHEDVVRLFGKDAA